MTIAFFNAVAVVTGHELFHKKDLLNKCLGSVPNSRIMYSQFIDEHVKGHHKMVSTLADPATSRKNEWLHTFVFRSIYGSFVNVWGYESDKITKFYGKDCSLLTRFCYNKMVWYQVLHVTILSGIYFFLGWESLKF
jgi:alkane 1-monooxygenase